MDDQSPTSRIGSYSELVDEWIALGRTHPLMAQRAVLSFLAALEDNYRHRGVWETEGAPIEDARRAMEALTDPAAINEYLRTGWKL